MSEAFFIKPSQGMMFEDFAWAYPMIGRAGSFLRSSGGFLIGMPRGETVTGRGLGDSLIKRVLSGWIEAT